VKKNTVIDFFNKYRYFLLLSAIALVLFNKYIVLIGLIIGLTMVGMLSVRMTMLVPHISIETITASSVLLGYIYDWKIGLGFGLIIGMYVYALHGFVKLKAIINVLLMGLCGVIAAIFASFGYSFTLAFMLTFIIRLILNNIIFPLVESDMFENFIHANGDPLFNMLITFQVINLIYNLVKLIP
jgi:hypothetical protein